MHMDTLIKKNNQRLLEALSRVSEKQLNKTQLSARLIESLTQFHNPNGDKFFNAYTQLPDLKPKSITVSEDTIKVLGDISKEKTSKIHDALFGLCPWRKGPFSVFDVEIDTEWHSNLKWDRIAPALPKLSGRRIIDIGCGSGYHMMRMASENPAFVLGVDPSPLYYFQFEALQKYLQLTMLHFAPLKLEDMTVFSHYFDLVVCMGVLYHQKSPLIA